MIRIIQTETTGGIISPVLANMALDGLENAVKLAATSKGRVCVVRYADDFIVTAHSKELLEQTVKPAIEQFMSDRGLQLSEEKTRITHIDEGFDFLGFNVRKYNDKLLIKPSRKSLKNLLQELKEIIKCNQSSMHQWGCHETSSIYSARPSTKRTFYIG